MIKHNKKRCKIESCDGLLFARGYCIYHYRKHYVYPKSKNKSRVTKKKIVINNLYSKNRLLFIDIQRNLNKERKLFCIFCGREILGEPSLHHALGRDDSVILDEKYWFLSHNFCHVAQYHSMSWKDIPWWNDYIGRIKDNEEVYKKEVKRMEK